MPPDLTKAQEVAIAGVSLTGNSINAPFTVPEDGWILSLIAKSADNLYSIIDGIGSFSTTPSQISIVCKNDMQARKFNIHCPYPVKKGQVVESSVIAYNGVYITSAPCMRV